MGLPEFTAALAREMQRANTNQSELGRHAQAAPAMISAWLRGQTANPEPQKVFDVERVLDLPPGHLSRHLGYEPVTNKPRVDVLAAIEDDPDLGDPDRDALSFLYNFLKRRSAELATVSEAPAASARKSRSARSR